MGGFLSLSLLIADRREEMSLIRDVDVQQESPKAETIVRFEFQARILTGLPKLMDKDSEGAGMLYFVSGLEALTPVGTANWVKRRERLKLCPKRLGKISLCAVFHPV